VWAGKRSQFTVSGQSHLAAPPTLSSSSGSTRLSTLSDTPPHFFRVSHDRGISESVPGDCTVNLRSMAKTNQVPNRGSIDKPAEKSYIFRPVSLIVIMFDGEFRSTDERWIGDARVRNAKTYSLEHWQKLGHPHPSDLMSCSSPLSCKLSSPFSAKYCCHPLNSNWMEIHCASFGFIGLVSQCGYPGDSRRMLDPNRIDLLRSTQSV
jgi:hypothetical protein